MRFVLVALLMVLPTVDGLADTSRQEKAKYIIETENFRGQYTARRDELIKITINELKEFSNDIRDLGRPQVTVRLVMNCAIVIDHEIVTDLNAAVVGFVVVG